MSITEKQREALKLKLRRGGPKANTEEIVKRYLAGERVSVIAEALGVQKETVYRHLRTAAKGE